MNQLNIPENNIAEITLIGTGGGYGESLVVHLGNQNWIVIDSCEDPYKKESLPLKYLQEINIELSLVKFVICTHWHDDHIQGISSLLDKCENAKLVIPAANDRAKFLQFVSLDYQKFKRDGSKSSTIEFTQCLEILKKRSGNALVKATVDKLLYKFTVDESHPVELIAISPSEETVNKFDMEISTLITDFGVSNRKIIVNSPNEKSVALYLKLGTHRAILGSDLEVGNNPNEGWLNVLNNSQSVDKIKKATFFKIPHHGSENGFDNRIWEELLESSPTGAFTPWNRKFKLPTPEMLLTYCEKSTEIYSTHPTINAKPKKRTKDITKLIGRFQHKIREIKFKKGIIRCRINIVDEESKWETVLIENAFHVNSLLKG